MNLRRFWGAFALMWAACAGYAQRPVQPGNYFEASFHLGDILKHTPSIILPLTETAVGGEFTWEVQTSGRKVWQHRAGYPRMGLAASFQYLNNPQQLGFGLGLMPHVSVDFFRRQRFRVFGRLAMGFAYLSRCYDPQHNPLNNIVGSHLNNNTAFRIGAAWRVSPQVELRPSVAFTHYSNGASQLPNYGINVLSFQLGVAYAPTKLAWAQTRQPDSLLVRNRRPQYSVFYGMGYRESMTNGGPKYPVLAIAADVGWFTGKAHRVRAGVEYEYNAAAFAFLSQLDAEASTAQQRWEASRVSLIVGDELLLGRLGIGANLGFYLTRNEMQPWFMHTRLFARVYLRDPASKRIAPYVGMTLKAHQITAEYFCFSLGAAIF